MFLHRWICRTDLVKLWSRISEYVSCQWGQCGMHWMIWYIQSGLMCIIIIGNGHLPLSFLLDFCKFLDWLAISSKTHPCFVKETIKCFVEEFVLKDTRYYLQVRWNCSILVICMITTIAYDVNVFPGNVAWLFCKKWVNFISFIPLLLEKQEKRDPSTSTNPRFPCSQQ